MTQQTAVDSIIKYCEEKLHTSVNSHGGAYTSIINFCKQQAKEMEKEQIKNAYNDGHTDGITAKPGLTSGTMYYNETHGDK
jgi:hypothetical protein